MRLPKLASFLLSIFSVLFIFCLTQLINPPTKAYADSCNTTLSWEGNGSTLKEVATGEEVIANTDSNTKGGTGYYIEWVDSQDPSNSGYKGPITGDRDGQGASFHFTVSKAGTYSVTLYNGFPFTGNNMCNGGSGLGLKVTGDTLTKDPTCDLGRPSDPTGVGFTVGDNVQFVVSGATPGDQYTLKYLVYGGTAQYQSVTPIGNQAIFYVQFTAAGDYTINAWHRKPNEAAQCGNDVVFTVRDKSTPSNPGGGTGSSAGSCINTPIGCLPTNMNDFASDFVSLATGIAGGVAFLLMVFGAYRLMFSAGNPEAIQQGRQVITAAVIGLVVIIFAVFILRLIGITILGLPI
jgi:hypothetical protein